MEFQTPIIQVFIIIYVYIDISDKIKSLFKSLLDFEVICCKQRSNWRIHGQQSRSVVQSKRLAQSFPTRNFYYSHIPQKSFTEHYSHHKLCDLDKWQNSALFSCSPNISCIVQKMLAIHSALINWPIWVEREIEQPHKKFETPVYWTNMFCKMFTEMFIVIVP